MSWKPHNAESVCKYNQFYRLQGKNRQNCVKEGTIFFTTCLKKDDFLYFAATNNVSMKPILVAFWLSVCS